MINNVRIESLLLKESEMGSASLFPAVRSATERESVIGSRLRSVRCKFRKACEATISLLSKG